MKQKRDPMMPVYTFLNQRQTLPPHSEGMDTHILGDGLHCYGLLVCQEGEDVGRAEGGWMETEEEAEGREIPLPCTEAGGGKAGHHPLHNVLDAHGHLLPLWQNDTTPHINAHVSETQCWLGHGIGYTQVFMSCWCGDGGGDR